MLEWVLIVICVLCLGLVGCKGVDRLTGTEKEVQEQSTPKVIIENKLIQKLGGVLTNDNFVKFASYKVPIDLDKIDVIIIRKDKRLTVNSYTKKADNEGHPYYIVSSNEGLAFFNINYGDEYQIFEYK